MRYLGVLRYSSVSDLLLVFIYVEKEDCGWSFEDKHWHPNQIRHSVATKVRKAYGIETASVILGHSEVGVTQIYAESDRARAVAATKEML